MPDSNIDMILNTVVCSLTAVQTPHPRVLPNPRVPQNLDLWRVRLLPFRAGIREWVFHMSKLRSNSSCWRSCMKGSKRKTRYVGQIGGVSFAKG